MNALWKIFNGVWACERHVSNPHVVMCGRAVFEEIAPHTRSLREDGSYTLNGVEHTFFQSQTWVLDQGQLTIYTHEHKVLHVFDAGEDWVLPCQLTHTHLCGEDTYEVVLDVLSPTHWRTQYQVTGPQKDYVSLTNYILAK